MATIKDVARLAGVSVSTVSRTLSKRAFVEEITRQKVLKAVEELHYQPSIAAKGLKEGKTYMIALLVPDINSSFYPMFMKYVEKYVAEKGYSLLLCNNNEELEQEKKAAWLLGSRSVDGILCMSVSDDVTHLVQFQREQKIPLILVNRSGTETLSSVSMDNEYGGYLMTKYLLNQGHTDIAVIFGNFDKERFRLRYNGCKRAFEEMGITGYKKNFVYDINSTEEAFQYTRNLLQRPDRPTAIFATMDILAIGAYSGIQSLGLQIPKDISVVGFDNIYMTKYMIPALTTYDPSVEELARCSVEALVEKIHNLEAESRNHVIRGSLMERDSVMCIKGN